MHSFVTTSESSDFRMCDFTIRNPNKINTKNSIIVFVSNMLINSPALQLIYYSITKEPGTDQYFLKENTAWQSKFLGTFP